MCLFCKKTNIKAVDHLGGGDGGCNRGKDYERQM